MAGADLVASSSTICDKPSSSPTVDSRSTENPADPTMAHPMFPRLHLAVWHISNDHAQQKAFQNRLPDVSQPLLVNRLTKLMTPHGENGVAGVINSES